MEGGTEAQFVKYFIDSRREIDRLKQQHKDLKSSHEDLNSRHEDLNSRHEDLKLRHEDLKLRHEEFEKELELRRERFEKELEARNEDLKLRHKEFEKELELRRERFEKEFEAHNKDSKKKLETRHEESKLRHEEFEKKLEARHEDFKLRQKELDSRYKDLDSRQQYSEKWIYGLLIGALAVLIFMSAAMLRDMWQFKSILYKEYSTSYENPQKSCRNNPDLNNIRSAIKDLKKEVKETNELNSHLRLIKAITDIANNQKILADTVEHLKEELKQLYNNEKIVLNLSNEQKTTNCLIQKLEKEIQNLVGKIKELEDTIQDERLARSIVNEQLLNDLSRDTTIEKTLESLSDTIEKSQH